MELDTAREAYNVGRFQTPASSSTAGFRSCEEIIESCGEDFKCKGWQASCSCGSRHYCEWLRFPQRCWSSGTTPIWTVR